MRSFSALAFHHANGLRQARRFLFAGLLRFGYAASFYANEGLVAIIGHIAHADGKGRSRVPANHVAVVMMDDIDVAAERIIVNDAAGFCIQIDAVGTIREGFSAVA